MIKETRWRYYMEDGRRFRIKSRYGIDYHFGRKYEQLPYFSVTGETEYKSRNNHWYESSSGAMGEEIQKRIPEIAPYVKWHMTDADGPHAYLENARFWLEMAQGVHSKKSHDDPARAFLHTIVFGVLPDDRLPEGLEYDLEHQIPFDQRLRRGPMEWSPRRKPHASWSEVRFWLEERLPKLQAAWVVDMGELGVLEQ